MFGMEYLYRNAQRLTIKSSKAKRIGMHSKTDEMILKTAKEIIVKFIEIRTVTPTTFYDHFQSIYTAVEKTVRKDESAKPPKE